MCNAERMNVLCTVRFGGRGCTRRDLESDKRWNCLALVCCLTPAESDYSQLHMYEILHLATLGVKPLGAHIRGAIIKKKLEV